MGMSTHVVGFRPPDERWLQMKAIWDACEAAKIDVPDDVRDFFNGFEPDPNGVEVNLEKSAAKPWSDTYREGFEIDVRKLPKDLTIIRFYNSW